MLGEGVVLRAASDGVEFAPFIFIFFNSNTFNMKSRSNTCVSSMNRPALFSLAYGLILDVHGMMIDQESFSHNGDKSVFSPKDAPACVSSPPNQCTMFFHTDCTTAAQPKCRAVLCEPLNLFYCCFSDRSLHTEMVACPMCA